ncbi:hypothetical protein AgCh_015056 [Apium graveolens]
MQYVRYQKGSFREALDGHKRRHSVAIVEKWKSALSEIAALSGHHLRKEANEKESEIIQKIVGDVAPRASTTVLHEEKHLVGIDSAVEEIYQTLSMESDAVRAIGISGMGGIGKCTISSGIRKLTQILHSKKALIVLDDLDCANYLELLQSKGNLFPAGSKIIITTRDANLLNKLKADISEVDTYMVKTLRRGESLKLFSYHAFRKSVPPESFKELSLNFVTHAGGLPLALKVLGSSLLGRTDESFWKEKLEKVKAIPENDIQKILQLSYDELEDDTQKKIFLDIAFFFVGKDKDEATDVFKSCDFFPGVGIQNLVGQMSTDIKNMNNLRELNLRCNVRLCLPMILCFSSLERLTLTDQGPILSSAKPFSLSKLFNLQTLILYNCTSLGSSLPELPLNLEVLYIYNHTSLEQLPDLSSLGKLRHLNIKGCINLQSISLLPSHLEELSIEECTSLQDVPDLSLLKINLEFYRVQQSEIKKFGTEFSSGFQHTKRLICIEEVPAEVKVLTLLYIIAMALQVSGLSLQSISLLPSHLLKLSVRESSILQDLPDLSMLKELQGLWLIQCNNLKSVSFKPSSFPFNANLPNREVAEWVTYKSSGHTVSFNIPPSFGSNFLSLALWVVFTCKSCKGNLWPYMKAVITNETEGVTENYRIDVHDVVGEAQSRVQCITGEKLSMKSGDRIKVSFPSLLYKEEGKEVVREEVKEGKEVVRGEVKVKMCGVHVM